MQISLIVDRTLLFKALRLRSFTTTPPDKTLDLRVLLQDFY
jgi:hypothetical protein